MFVLFFLGWKSGASFHAAVLHLRRSGSGAVWKTRSVLYFSPRDEHHSSGDSTVLTFVFYKRCLFCFFLDSDSRKKNKEKKKRFHKTHGPVKNVTVTMTGRFIRERRRRTSTRPVTRIKVVNGRFVCLYRMLRGEPV